MEPNSQSTAEPRVACGQEITESITLDADLVCTTAPALIIAADNITVDLGGYTITGQGDASMGPGIVFRDVSGSTLQKGTITHFGAGVAINGGSKNVVQNISASDNIGTPDGDFGDGIVVTDSSNNRIEGNTVANNGPFSGISLIGASAANEVRNNTVTGNNMPGNPGAGRRTMGIRVEGPAADNNKIVANTVTGSGADGIVVLATCLTPDTGCAGTPPNQGNEIRANMSHRNGISGRGDGIRLFGAGPEPVAPAHTTIIDNVADENTTHGISIDAIGGANPDPPENVITGNSGHGNGDFDGFDGNAQPACGTNTWTDNDFGTFNQPCVGQGAAGS